jgi:casein kinase II subunit beta
MDSFCSSSSDSSLEYSSDSRPEEFELDERSWMEWFHSPKENSIFVEIDQEYALDKFNLTGLMLDDPTYFQDALALITDTLEEHEKLLREFENDKARRNQVVATALQMYGLIHARYILTPAGMKKMTAKYEQGIFGSCPRTLCQKEFMLPCGLFDAPRLSGLKLFCPKCKDIYDPVGHRYQFIDGACFGSTFPHLFLLSCTENGFKKKKEPYIPKIFGFKIHSSITTS